MEMAQDEREIPLRKPAAVVDHRASRQGLDPSGKAVARCAKFGISGVIESSHTAV